MTGRIDPSRVVHPARTLLAGWAHRNEIRMHADPTESPLVLNIGKNAQIMHNTNEFRVPG